MITEIKDKIDFFKSIDKTYPGICANDIAFMVMAQTHIRHKKYDFDEIVMSHKSNSIYLYKNRAEVMRISDHYSPYGFMCDDYLERQGVIMKVPNPTF